MNDGFSNLLDVQKVGLRLNGPTSQRFVISTQFGRRPSGRVGVYLERRVATARR